VGKIQSGGSSPSIVKSSEQCVEVTYIKISIISLNEYRFYCDLYYDNTD